MDSHVFSRLFILIGTVLAYLAYFPPMTVQEKLGIQDYCVDMYTIEELEEKLKGTPGIIT